MKRSLPLTTSLALACTILPADTYIEALESATYSAAKALRMENDLGTIEAGKLADIIAVPGDPTGDISIMMKVSFVMKEGVVYKD